MLTTLRLFSLILISTYISCESSSSITVGEITWTFSQSVEIGYYASGEPFVVGPVDITSISPTLVESPRVMHGSMKNSPCGGSQGLDGGGHYDETLNAELQFPIHLDPGDFLVSGVSNEDLSVQHTSYLRQVSFLTSLESILADPVFRKGYCLQTNTETMQKDFLTKSQVYPVARVPQIPPFGTLPTLARIQEMVEYPNFDMISGWSGRYFHPTLNIPSGNYGRELSNGIGQIGLWLMTNTSDATVEDKEDVLLKFIQMGIDYYYMVHNGCGGCFANDGGHASGRKFPIIFAGLFLDDPDLKAIGEVSGDYMYEGENGNPVTPPSDYIHFGEDDQTFYVSAWDVEMTNDATWNPDTRADTAPYTNANLNMPEWSIRRAGTGGGHRGNLEWGAMYRTCCTAVAWPNWVLATQLIGGKGLWNHDALFDYQHRYMKICAGDGDSFSPAAPGTAEFSGWGCWDGMGCAMWNEYKDHEVIMNWETIGGGSLGAGGSIFIIIALCTVILFLL